MFEHGFVQSEFGNWLFDFVRGTRFYLRMLVIQPVKHAEQDSSIVSYANDCRTSRAPTRCPFATCVLYNGFKILRRNPVFSQMFDDFICPMKEIVGQGVHLNVNAYLTKNPVQPASKSKELASKSPFMRWKLNPIRKAVTDVPGCHWCHWLGQCDRSG